MTGTTRRHYYRELAASLVNNGYEIVPVVAGGKRPANGNEWQEKTTTTLAQVEAQKSTYGNCSIGIVGRTTPALDFDILHKGLSDYMLATAQRILGGTLPIRYGHKPKFLIPGRWPGGIAPSKRVSKLYIDAHADPLDPQLVIYQVEFLGDGQQWVAIGDHDKAATKYEWLDDLVSPVATRHDQLVEFTDEKIDALIAEFEWTAENEFGLVEYVRPGKGLNGLNGHAHVNGTVYEKLAEPGKPPETEYEIARVRTALAYYSATSIGRNYDAFIVPVFAVQWCGWECGEELIMEWSAKSPWHVEKMTRHVYRHPTRRKDKHPITISTLFALAKEAGWDGSVPFDEIAGDDAATADGDNDLAGPDATDKPGGRAKDGVKVRLAKMIEKFAVVKVGRNAMVYQDYGPKQVPEPMTPQAFRTLQANNFVDVVDPNNPKKVTRVKMHDVFMNAPERPTFERVVFKPEEPALPGEYNLWRGVQVDPVAGDVKPWLDLLAHLLPDERDRNYVLSWLALKIQHPGLVPGTFLIMKGEMGIGKGALFAPIMRIFGEHAKAVDKANQLVGQFSGHLEYTILVLLEEAVFAGDPRHVETLKHMVTADYLTVESKGVDARRVKNHCAFINLTNQEYAWRTTGDERRAGIFQIPSTLKGNKEFWNYYWAWANSDAGVPALYHFLKTLDVSGFDIRNIPKGEGYREQLERTVGRDPASAFLLQILTDGKLPGRSMANMGNEFEFDENHMVVVPRDLLRDSYEEFTKRGFGSFVPAFQTACQTIYKLLEIDPKAARAKTRNIENVAERVNGTKFPSLKEMRAAFFRQTGIVIDGQEDEI